VNQKPFATLCAIVRRVLDSLGSADDTTLTDAVLQVVYRQKLSSTKPEIERAIRAVRHTIAKQHAVAIAAVPSDELTVEQARGMGYGGFLDWVERHKQDRPPSWYCSHYEDDGGPLCATIAACLQLAREDVA
jgi:hypothetical protein